MTKSPQPTWDTRSKNLTEDEVMDRIYMMPLPRLLRSLQGYPSIIEAVAEELDDQQDNKKDLIWVSSRLRIFFLVFEQRCLKECDELKEEEEDDECN